MRILIVEDEPLIANVVANMVAEHGVFEVAGIASNGIDAINCIRSEKIDAAITDIRMPGMDGLELLQIIDSEFPYISTVIISGYQVFSYAQTAIQYQAFDYLLKPITRSKLYQVLDRLEIACRDKTKVFLEEAIHKTGKVSYGNTDSSVVMVLCAGALPYANVGLLAPGQVFWDSLDMEEMVRGITNRQALLFSGKSGMERVLLLEQQDASHARVIANKLYQRLTANTDLAITLVGHAQPVKVPQIGEIIDRLQLLLYHEIRLFKSQFIWQDCMKPMNAQPQHSLKKMPTEDVVEAIIINGAEQVEESIRHALTVLHKMDYTQIDFMRFLDAVINDSRFSSGMNTQEYAAVKNALTEAVLNNVAPVDLARDLSAIFASLGKEKDNQDKSNVQHIMIEMEQYLIENFNKPITHEMLAKKYGFVPSYLSRKFKEYKYMSPYEYMVHLRLEKAKELMDMHPDMYIRDIAHVVGYTDHHYFTKLFKKEMGMLPTEYLQR